MDGVRHIVIVTTYDEIGEAGQRRNADIDVAPLLAALWPTAHLGALSGAIRAVDPQLFTLAVVEPWIGRNGRDATLAAYRALADAGIGPEVLAGEAILPIPSARGGSHLIVFGRLPN